MYYGVDYYPEHWSEERWEIDADLMKKAGINVVRLAEFSWAKLEPKEGYFDFSWLDRAIEILNSYNIKVILGTPTAAPPMWLVKKYPEVLPVDKDGHIMGPGGRRYYCYNSLKYRELSEKIVTQMALHYRDHAGVIGWQIDNEFGCHESNRCYCDNCLKAFKEWLKKKYGNLENLNNSWGTIFWSQTYTDWDEIILPRRCVGAHNPSLLLDFYRFVSDSFVEYQQLQIDIIRKICPEKFVTHNFMGSFGGLDYFRLGERLDFVSWDNYPYTNWTFYPKSIGTKQTPWEIAFAHDLMRGIKDKNFWVMEEQSGPAGWEVIFPTPAPGEIRLWSYQAIAHGADAVVYFRWRTSRYGTEQYWHGILDHDGVPRRRYEEVKKMGKELKEWGIKIEGSTYYSEVAIAYSYDIRWAFEIQPNNPELDYMEQIKKFYLAFFEEHIPLDIVPPDRDFSKYKLVIIPSLYLVNDKILKNIINYLNDGGNLLFTLRSGVKDWNNIVTSKTLPGDLSEILGIEIIEYSSLEKDRKVTIEGFGAKEYKGKAFLEVLYPKTARVLSKYIDSLYVGEPAITLNDFGKGEAIYVGVDLEEESIKELVGFLVKRYNIEKLAHASKNIEVTKRVKDKSTLYFILNHGDTEENVKLYTKNIERVVALKPKDVLIIEES